MRESQASSVKMSGSYACIKHANHNHVVGLELHVLNALGVGIELLAQSHRVDVHTAVRLSRMQAPPHLAYEKAPTIQ